MRHSGLALFAMATLVLTGCGPTTDEVTAMAASGSSRTYDDALALREDIIDAGVPCPWTDQITQPPWDHLSAV